MLYAISITNHFLYLSILYNTALLENATRPYLISLLFYKLYTRRKKKNKKKTMCPLLFEVCMISFGVYDFINFILFLCMTHFLLILYNFLKIF